MIQHVSVEARADAVPDLLRFLRALGFHEVPVPEGLAGRSVWAQLGPSQVHVLLTDQPVAPPKGHFAVVAADYEATLARLREAGFAPEPRAEHWGAARAFVRGPGGHVAEVMAAPPPGA